MAEFVTGVGGYRVCVCVCVRARVCIHTTFVCVCVCVCEREREREREKERCICAKREIIKCKKIYQVCASTFRYSPGALGPC